MRSKIIHDASEKPYVLILEIGEEVLSQLRTFDAESRLTRINIGSGEI